MYAVHSIPYTAANQNALRSYFYGFGVWDENNTLLAWDQTIEVFQMLDINPASVLYHGPYHDGLADEFAAKIDPARHEGSVLRDAGPNTYLSGYGYAGSFFADTIYSPV